jgi:hypothetical protein
MQFSSCVAPVDTSDLDSSIALLSAEIDSASEESRQYEGGLLKILIDSRKQVLQNTKAMLEQKRTGLNRYIKMSYAIDGVPYEVPADKEERLEKLTKEMADLEKDIGKAQLEASQYSGGLIQLMLLSQIATSKNTIAMLRQQELLLAHDIPLYSFYADSESSTSVSKPAIPKRKKPKKKQTEKEILDQL